MKRCVGLSDLARDEQSKACVAPATDAAPCNSQIALNDRQLDAADIG